MNPEDIPGLPKVRKDVKTGFGVLCKRHPEHYGFRYLVSWMCVACIQARGLAKNRAIVDHAPDGTPISRSLANSREIVDHTPDGTPISRSLAASREIVDHASDGTPISRNLAISRAIVDHAPDGTPISYGLAKSREIVGHDPDGTPISRGLAKSREIVGHDPDGTPISYGLAKSRNFLSTPEGRAKHVAKWHAYYARLDENTRALNLSPEEVELTNQVVKQIEIEGLTVDHMQPASKGGAHVYWNLNGLTGSTNSSKSDKELDLSATPHWLEMLEQGRAPDYYQRLVSKILRRGNYESE